MDGVNNPGASSEAGSGLSHDIAISLGPGSPVLSGVPGDLCSRCRSIRLPSPSLTEPKPLWKVEHGTVRDIFDSSRHGCAFCTLIAVKLKRFRELPAGLAWRDWLELFIELEFEDGELIFKLLESKYASLRRVKFKAFPQYGNSVLQNTLEWDLTYILDILDCPDSVTTLSKLEPESLPDFQLSEESFEQAKQWLSSCSSSHQRCRIVSGNTLPTRVIDLAGPDPKQLRLHITAEAIMQQGSYVALSYCWGESKAFITTPETLLDRIRGFYLADLPLTLRDVVLVTRKLGFRYLWVDALCILQGAVEEARKDWEIESSRMASVYSNAAVTILAAASDDCDTGLFYPRHCYLPFGNPIDDGQFNAGQFMIVEQTETRKHKDEPLNSRAWALQERLLSKRTLIYGANDLVWQCNEKLLSKGRDGSEFPEWHFIYKYRLSDTIDWQGWKCIVENYCSRNLTISSDKLPAIAGLARLYSQTTGDQYLAGLWESTLLGELLWTRRHDLFGHLYANSEISAPSAYRAPSWSWASVDGIVSFILRGDNWKDSDATSTVVRCTTEIATLDEFGQVLGGELLIKGVFKRATRIAMQGRVPAVFCEDNSFKEFFLSYIYLDGVDEERTCRMTETGMVYCLLFKKFDHMGLLLVPVPGPHLRYSRIGVFFLGGKLCTRQQLEWFENTTVETITIV